MVRDFALILLDINICTYLINKKPVSLLERFKQFRIGEIGISSVAAAELAFRVQKTESAQNMQALNLFLASMKILPFDADCVWTYGLLQAKLEKLSQSIGTIDALIAAQALALDLPLITHSPNKFSQVPGLKVLNWA